MENTVQEKEQAQDEFPVFLITGSNFTATCCLDEFNSKLEREHQIFEAATRVIETLMNVREKKNCKITMNGDSRNELPSVGVTVLVCKKDENPERAVPIPTYLLFANFGDYPKADEMQTKFKKEFEAMKKNMEQHSKKELENSKDIADFEKFQQQKIIPKKKLYKKKKT